MLKFLLLTALLASAHALPREKGERVFNPLEHVPGRGPSAHNTYPRQISVGNYPQHTLYSQQVQPLAPEPKPELSSLTDERLQQTSNSILARLRGRPHHNLQPIGQISTMRQNPQPVTAQGSIALPSNLHQELWNSLYRNPPGGALLIGSNPPNFPIEKRLISNYTKLRSHVTDNFRCDDSQAGYAGYGYYADVENDCQIFHICLPWHQLYPNVFKQPLTYQYSFICPNQTVFSQDTMSCSYRSEALPCDDSPALFWLNRNFFRLVPDGAGGLRHAMVFESLKEPLKYDYLERAKEEPVGRRISPQR
ncbi:hypothetical protein SK128_017682 [Halocaridina rubra]|uniref:Chitin-binding type-2 domain-containing protein n=1 Tax=Halocaridina rubra TaxID=373956 RepID=A0AAN8X575_HALRR